MKKITIILIVIIMAVPSWTRGSSEILKVIRLNQKIVFVKYDSTNTKIILDTVAIKEVKGKMSIKDILVAYHNPNKMVEEIQEKKSKKQAFGFLNLMMKYNHTSIYKNFVYSPNIDKIYYKENSFTEPVFIFNLTLIFSTLLFILLMIISLSFFKYFIFNGVATRYLILPMILILSAELLILVFKENLGIFFILLFIWLLVTIKITKEVKKGEKRRKKQDNKKQKKEKNE